MSRDPFGPPRQRVASVLGLGRRGGTGLAVLLNIFMQKYVKINAKRSKGEDIPGSLLPRLCSLRGGIPVLTFVIVSIFQLLAGSRASSPAPDDAAMGAEGASKQGNRPRLFSDDSPASQSLCYTQGSLLEQSNSPGK